jgi:putative Holliday junction resolvase
MIVLGIDYGKRKIGVAVSSGIIAQPLGVLRVSSRNELLRKIKEVFLREGAERVVVGISEGRMKEEQLEFVHELSKELGIKVETWDETLSTKDAQTLSLLAGVKRKRREKSEDAFAAAVVLQSFLDACPEDDKKSKITKGV